MGRSSLPRPRKSTRVSTGLPRSPRRSAIKGGINPGIKKQSDPTGAKAKGARKPSASPANGATKRAPAPQQDVRSGERKMLREIQGGLGQNRTVRGV